MPVQVSNQLQLYGLGSVTFIGQMPRPKLTNQNANMLLQDIYAIGLAVGINRTTFYYGLIIFQDIPKAQNRSFCLQ